MSGVARSLRSLVAVCGAAAVACTSAPEPEAAATSAAASGSVAPPVASIAMASSPAPAPTPPASSSAPAVAPPLRTSLVREEITPTIDGVTERWTLRWKEMPELACTGEGWMSCPCSGAAYGESGSLELARSRPGHPEEIFSLGEVMLQRWPPLEKDSARYGDHPDMAVVRRRPEVKVMELSDVNRDGRAAEFILHHGSSPCGAYHAVVAGLRPDGKLGWLGTKEQPGQPLSLNGYWQWQRFAAAKKEELERGLELVMSPCGDHGSGSESTRVLRYRGGDLTVESRRYGCNAKMQRGALAVKRPYDPNDEWP